jgi:hypothetical protein
MATNRKAPEGLYPGYDDSVIGRGGSIRYKATGEFRPPKRGEYYLSGAIIAAYKAYNDLTTPFWLAKPGRVTTTVTHHWEPI